MDHAERKEEEAVRLFGASEALLRATGGVLEPAEINEHEGSLAECKSALGEPVFSAAWEEGQGMTIEQALDYAREGV